MFILYIGCLRRRPSETEKYSRSHKAADPILEGLEAKKWQTSEVLAKQNTVIENSEALNAVGNMTRNYHYHQENRLKLQKTIPPKLSFAHQKLK